MTLTVGSLFSGIGGLDLGLERAGMKVIWQSEIDSYATRVLKKHWPEVPNHGDIKRIQWGDIVRPDVICGGYPCQPFSLAGARKGEEDPRHLWPWVRHALSVLRPRYAILENVRGHLSLGGTTVLREITALGYCAEWRIVSAASVGANHRRDRIIIVAYPNRENESDGTKHEIGIVAYPNGRRLQAREPETESLPRPCGSRERRREVFADNITDFGRRGWWQTEPDVGRVAHGIPHRVDRLKGLGNAVVPQVAEIIGRLVLEHHNTTTPH